MSGDMSKVECDSCGCEIVRDVYHRLRNRRLLCRDCFDREIETPRFVHELKRLLQEKSPEELGQSSRAEFLVSRLEGKLEEEEPILEEKGLSFGEVKGIVRG